MELSLILPWPPSLNHYKRIGKIVRTKSGKYFQQRPNSSETQAYFQSVWVETRTKLQGWEEIAVSATSKFMISIYMHPPSKRRYDLDNHLKVLLDSLVRAYVIRDDSQIHKLYVEKREVVEGGRVVVGILVLE